MKRITLIIILGLFSVTLSAQKKIPKWKIGELEEYINRSERPVIVNFWATYCVPCIEEIPYFIELVKKFKKDSIDLVLVSMDFEEMYPDKIRKFADKRKFNASIAWLDETNADYFCPRIDSSWSGVMPATLFVNNKTGFRSFYEEQIPKEKLEAEIKKLVAQ